ncbi:hypothetical protein BKA93DRAFT_752774 [Sparassis latifolia]
MSCSGYHVLPLGKSDVPIAKSAQQRLEHGQEETESRVEHGCMTMPRMCHIVPSQPVMAFRSIVQVPQGDNHILQLGCPASCAQDYSKVGINAGWVTSADLLHGRRRLFFKFLTSDPVTDTLACWFSDITLLITTSVHRYCFMTKEDAASALSGHENRFFREDISSLAQIPVEILERQVLLPWVKNAPDEVEVPFSFWEILDAMHATGKPACRPCLVGTASGKVLRVQTRALRDVDGLVMKMFGIRPLYAKRCRPQPPVDELSPLNVAGSIATAILYGVTSVQTFIYYQEGGADPVLLKVLRQLSRSILAHIAMAVSLAFSLCPIYHSLMVEGASDLVVDSLFCQRVWRLSNKNKLLVLAITIALLVPFGNCIGEMFSTMSVSADVAKHILIATALCILLKRQCTGFSRLVIWQADLQNNLIINTGVLTGVSDLACLVTVDLTWHSYPVIC